VHVFAGREVPASVIGERTVLASQGVAHATVPLTSHGTLAGPIVLVTRGVADAEGGARVVASAEADARAAVDEAWRTTLARRAPPASDDEIAEAVRLAVRRSLARALGFKPLTMVTVVRVR
jgi:mRNA degradation ribonuclease J1/J2